MNLTEMAIAAAAVVVFGAGCFYKGYEYEKVKFEAAMSKALEAKQEEASKNATQANDRALVYEKKVAEARKTQAALQSKLDQALASRKTAPECNDSPEVHQALNDIIAATKGKK